MQIVPLHADILVEDMFFGEVKTASGIIITDDDMKDRGIHNRWAKIYAIGHQNKSDLEIGDWILIEHGRWSRAMKVDGIDTTVRKVDPKAILLKSKSNPEAKNWFFEGKE